MKGSQRLNVLLYDGIGTSVSLQKSLFIMLKHSLKAHFDVMMVNEKVLLQQPWQDSTALLVMPGGRDLLYLDALKSEGCEKIRKYVHDGGRYLGVCAGAYFAANELEFEVDRPEYKVDGKRPLKFFPGLAKGSVVPGFKYASEAGAAAVTIKPLDGTSNPLGVYVNGGPYFTNVEPSRQHLVETVAAYDDNTAAIVKCSVGSGWAILTGPHLEVNSHHIEESIKHLETDIASGRGETEQLSKDLEKLQAMLKSLRQDDVLRLELFTELLSSLGLEVSREITSEDTTTYPIWISTLAASDAQYIKDHLLRAATSQDGHIVSIQDFTGIFVVSESEAAFDVVGDGEQPVRFCDSSKCFDDFSIAKYQTYLGRFSTGQHQSFGAVLLYSPRVGSTQTTLENWISQKGCMMFSMRLLHPQASSLIFLQYLTGLAVVRAVKSLDGCSHIPIHLKWPNDIYVRAMDGTLKKVGGILVTSEYVNNTFGVTIGCGVNVLNAKPSTCLQEFTTASLDVEMVLARVMVELQALYQDFLHPSLPGDPFADFRESYYSFWLHSNQQVQVRFDDGSVRDVLVRGLDPSGFLKAKTLDGELILLQPDGNSFDMTKGLITVKV
ncbi:biotin holocarboxylase synthetase [Kappamyces sp. JEL0829]|nr:biotin holocarboxylase synthetase [Kappamyces sp. JEL0829]